MPAKSKAGARKTVTPKPRSYVKKSLSLASSTVKTRLHVWGFKDDGREFAACDLTFEGDLGKVTAYLSEADARRLARFILDNTEESS